MKRKGKRVILYRKLKKTKGFYKNLETAIDKEYDDENNNPNIERSQTCIKDGRMEDHNQRMPKQQTNSKKLV